MTTYVLRWLNRHLQGDLSRKEEYQFPNLLCTAWKCYIYKMYEAAAIKHGALGVTMLIRSGHKVVVRALVCIHTPRLDTFDPEKSNSCEVCSVRTYCRRSVGVNDWLRKQCAEWIVSTHGPAVLLLHRFSWNLIFLDFLKNLSKFKFHYNMTRITGTLREDVYTFMIISC